MGKRMNIKKIYFDMDGVLADFDRGVIKLCGIEPMDQLTRSEEDNIIFWEHIARIKHFYDKLEPMDGALEMLNLICEKYGDKVEILTGIPKPYRNIPTAGEDKINWVRRLLDKNLKINIVFREDKKQFCTGKDCILVDDLKTNIDEWEESCGTGILHISPEDTMKRLEVFGINVSVK